MNELENLEPKRLWKHFYDLTQVPHPSYHLEKMQQHLLEFGKKIGVETILDEAGNVILRKPATPFVQPIQPLVPMMAWVWQQQWLSWKTIRSFTVRLRLSLL